MDITPEQRTYARLAGIMYLLKFVLEGVGDGITIISRGSSTFAETARWAAESALLYRVALVQVAAAWIVTAILAFALYAVLEPVNKRLAQLALFLRLGASFVGAASVMLRVAQLRLYQASTTEGLFTTEQLRTLVSVSTRASSAGVTIAWMFLGAGGVLFFILFLRSRYLPRALAGFGLVTSALVVAMGIAAFVFPERSNAFKLVLLPALLADIAMGVWLLFKGLQARAPAEARV